MSYLQNEQARINRYEASLEPKKRIAKKMKAKLSRPKHKHEDELYTKATGKKIVHDYLGRNDDQDYEQAGTY